MAETTPQDAVPLSESEIVAARRAKLKRFRDELGFEPYGERVDGLHALADARAKFSEDAHVAYDTAAKQAKLSGGTGPIRARSSRSLAASFSTAIWESSCFCFSAIPREICS